MKIQIKNVRLSYAQNLLKPSPFYKNATVYTAELLIDKSDTAALNIIKKAISDAQQEGVEFKKSWQGKVPKTLINPLKDGDVGDKGEAYKGCYWLRVKSWDTPPMLGIFNRSVRKIEAVNAENGNENEIYSGCYGVASLSFFPYDTNGNNGIGVSINSFCKTLEGVNLSGAPRNISEDLDESLFEDIINDENDDIF